MFAITDDGKKVILNDDGTWDEIAEPIVQDNDFDVRKVVWGMTVSEVRKSEALEVLDAESNLLSYKTQIAGFEAFLLYDFLSNELCSVRYMFLHEHSDDGDFINDFDTLKDNLIKKYGKPSQDDRYFTDDLYEDTFGEWGMSLSRGKLSFFTKWNINNTEILLALYGDNYEISFNLSYTGLEYKTLLAQEGESQLFDDL